MASTINASTTLGLISTADTSGVLQLQTANTTAVTVDASQNVGVGMTPVYKLDVTGGNGNAIRFTDSVNSVQVAMGAFNSQGFFGTLSNHPQLFYVNSGEGMRLTSTGLGIGTSSPSASFKLDVTGLIRSNATANGGGQVTIAKSGTTVGVLCGSGNVIGSAATDLALYAETGNAVSIFTNGSATARATFDTSGNLLLGVTSSTGLTGTGDFAMPNNRAIRFRNAANSAYLNMIYVDTSNNLNFGFGGVPPNITFGINGIGEVSRFDSSGNFLVGTTNASLNSRGVNSSVFKNQASQDTLGLNQNSNSYYNLVSVVSTTSGTRYHIGFGDGNSSFAERGSISTNGTSTSYTTTSDYRLKENIQPMQNALAKVAALKPCTYTWKSNGSNGEGFIAHELQEVVPQCVSGEKDAVDADGNPVNQGIDTSFLVATLTSALQELNAKFEAYVASHP